MNRTINFIAALLISFSVSAQYEKLVTFTGPNGAQPWGSLVSDGTYMYGMTAEGGANDMGVIFKVLPDGTDYQKLLDFAGTANGQNPLGSLYFDGTFLYGMTAAGGASNNGIIFKIMPDGTGFVNLLDFTAATTGRSPNGSLISDGTFLYGMTTYGGANDFGTVFKILKDGTGYVKLLDFTGTANGSYPFGDLLLEGTALFGTTFTGGSNNRGTVFKIQPDGTGYQKLVNFSGFPASGDRPMGSLVSDGTFLYGTTSAGGASNDGTIFRLRIDIGGVTPIKSFRLEKGDQPVASLLIIGTDLYGMTYRGGEGGTNPYGTMFKIKGDGGSFTKLFDFTTIDSGWLPNGSLITDGSFLYGMTQGGGAAGASGTLFKYQLPPTPTITGFTPADGPTGTVVTITGTNFSDTPEKNMVNFNGWPATVTASTTTSITVTVPPAATTGPVTVTVLGNTGTSATDFTVTPGGVPIHKFDWVDGFAGSLDTFVESMTTDPDGNILTVGGFSETTDFDPGAGVNNMISAGNFDGFISKYNPQGELQWAFRFGDVDTDNATGVATDEDGNIYVTGTCSGNTVDLDPGPGVLTFPGTFTGFICKYDTDGNLIWGRQLDTNLVGSVDIMVTPGDKIYIASGWTNTADFDPTAGVANMTSNGSSDAFVLKLNSAGDFIWARGWGGTLSEYARGVDVDPGTGDVHVTGFFSGAVDFDPGSGVTTLTAPTNASDAFILKLNSDGDFVWVKSVGGGGAGATDSGQDIAVDDDGNVVVVGVMNGSGDFDPGVPVYTLASEGAGDIFVLKLDEAGEFVWAKSIGGSSSDLGWKIETDGDGNVYYSGDYGRTVDFDPGPGVYNLTASTGTTINDHAYVSKLDPDGNFIWAWSSSGVPAIAEIPILALDNNDDIILSGTFEFGTVDFDPGDCENSLTAGVGVGMYLTKLSTTAIGGCLPPANEIVFSLQPSSKSDCKGPITFNVTASGDDNLVYQWQVDDGGGYADLADDATYSGVNTSTLTITDPQVSMTGFIYRVNVKGDNTTDTPSDGATLTFTLPPPIPVVTDPAPVCPAAVVTLTASGGTEGNYRWYDGATLINGQQNSTYDVTATAVPKIYGATIDDGVCESDMAVVEVTIATDCTEPGTELVVYNAVSPNGDGKNDVFVIENIEQLQSTRTNKVFIYNRWGDVVFETDNYDNTTSVFKGLSKGGKELPSGTYYYRIEFEASEEMTGYLSLRR